MSATLTKTAARAVNSRIRELRAERRKWADGATCHGATHGARARQSAPPEVRLRGMCHGRLVP